MCLTLYEATSSLPKHSCNVTLLPGVVRNSDIPHHCQHLTLSVFLNLAWFEWVCCNVCALSSHFSYDKQCWSFLKVLLAIYLSSFGKCPFKTFIHYSSDSFVLSKCVMCVSLSIYIDIYTYIYLSFCQIIHYQQYIPYHKWYAMYSIIRIIITHYGLLSHHIVFVHHRQFEVQLIPFLFKDILVCALLKE